jgi:transposase InsO family protein
VGSVDQTGRWRWRIWPTWALVAVDHLSRMVTTVYPLEGPNAGWLGAALEEAFVQHGSPRHLVTDQEKVFTSEVFADLLADWNVKHRFGAVGKHASIAVTERLIWTLRREWLAQVPLIRGLHHLGELLAAYELYYNQCRSHRRLHGATPSMIYEGRNWRKPGRSAKTPRRPIRLRHFREQRITVNELGA